MCMCSMCACACAACVHVHVQCIVVHVHVHVVYLHHRVALAGVCICNACTTRAHPRTPRTRAHLERLEHNEAADDGVGRGDGGHDLACDLLDLPPRLARDVEDLRPEIRGGRHKVERLRVVLVELQPAALLVELGRAVGVHALDGAEEDLHAYAYMHTGMRASQRARVRDTRMPHACHVCRLGGRWRRGGPLRSPRGSRRVARPRRGRLHRAGSCPAAAAPLAWHAPSTMSPVSEGA